MQVSEPARLAGADVHLRTTRCATSDELRASLVDFVRPMLIVGAVHVRPVAARAGFRRDRRHAADLDVRACSLPVHRLRYFFVLQLDAVLGLAALLAIVRAVSAGAHHDGFTDPWADPFGSGFQLTQSLIAIGSPAKLVRRRTRQQCAETVLSAGSAHGFRLRRDRGGIRA